MSFLCEQNAIFTKNVQMNNVVGTTTLNGKLHVNSTIETNNIDVKNNLTVNSLNIYDKIIDLSNNGGGTIDSALSTSSTNPVQNSTITNALNTKQDTITDLSTNGFLSAGSNITLSLSGSNITVNASSGGDATYFVCYVSSSSVTSSGSFPRTILFDTIARQYPTTGTLSSGSYVIQETGSYWLQCSIIVPSSTGLDYMVMYITRSGTTTALTFFTPKNNNSLVYNCQQNDLITVKQTNGGSSLTYSGAGNTNDLSLNTILQGYKLG
jgi:hypothetical protein